MRIISGILKGRTLNKKLPSGVRPTTDAAREAIFNILSNAFDFEEVSFLDLFAGSGAMGMEAISRGCRNVYFNDKSRKVIGYIKSNLEVFGVRSEDYTISNMDSYKLLSDGIGKGNKFDIIFIDPPYKDKYIYQLIEGILKNELLENRGLIVIEFPKNDVFELSEELSIYKEKVSGMSRYLFLEYV